MTARRWIALSLATALTPTLTLTVGALLASQADRAYQPRHRRTT